ncbi:MAG: hypothetical protein ACRELX_07105, partial [Longimicrobiales bacterium]
MSDRRRVVFVALEGAGIRPDARAWLETADVVEKVIEPRDLDAAALAPGDVVWIDAEHPVFTATQPLHALLADATGPGVLLTGGAAALPHAVGLEPVAPNGVIARDWHYDEDELFFGSLTTPRLRGHASFRGHPLFDGLGAATFTWCPADGERYRATTYLAPD